jgi:FAD/FMN-containing dehydrogenase/Fe-S oxidoreductase
MSDSRDILSALARRGVQADTSHLSRALYSSDASLYRVVPRVVVQPRDVDEVLATVDACAETETPVTPRGAGTSIAGNAVGTGLVLDLSRHLNAVRSVDAEASVATVEPGTVHASLQRAARPHGLRFGPDPSTHTRCTIGGMIGNNACGSRALSYGRTSDNIVGLDVVTIGGERLRLAKGSATASPSLDALQTVIGGGLATIRQEFGRFGRQVSGYSLEHLLPERRFDVSTFLAGTEGTLAVVLGATVRLVSEPADRVLLLLGYVDMATAADAVPAVLTYAPTACEGLDSRIVDVVRGGGQQVPDLPRGNGWLFVELAGDELGEPAARAHHAAAAAGALGARIVTDPGEQAELWRLREDGAGLAARALSRPGLSGWEDAAVPPHRLGAYLREFDALLRDHDLAGVPYGHFGDGCVHIRIDFPLGEVDGRQRFRRFLTDAARLVAGYGGSLSGEHGDGRARSELLPMMYSPAALKLFGAVKQVFDPRGLLNPGVLVEPRAVDDDLRGARDGRPVKTVLRLTADDGDISQAVHRCTGVGKCLADNTGTAGVMCPSYLATREQKDSTRGRARVLQEMLDGRLVRGGWRAPEVREALDLCLACKGCLSDCPTGVDMASYKAEMLYQAYRGRLRPRSHYVMGRLPLVARLSAPCAALVNRVLASRLGGAAARWSAGLDRRRGIPRFAKVRFSAWAKRRADQVRPGPRVLLWADTFSEYFAPEQAQAAMLLLEDAGYVVDYLERPACCGLTWISTGQLDGARRHIADLVDRLHPYAADGVPVVGLEPSCVAAVRSDAVELLDDPRVVRVAGAVRTLSELLTTTPGWSPPDLSGTRVVVQPHCHQHAVLGFGPDAALLASTGASIEQLGGCCGLAGNFGVERGHYEVSVAVAEQALLPAVRAAAPGTAFLADGFSCRIQLADLAGVRAVHLATLLAEGLGLTAAASRGKTTSTDGELSVS